MTQIRLPRRWPRALGSLLAALCLVALPPQVFSIDELAPVVAQVVDAELQVVDFDWVDGARGRDVPVRLYWPAHLAADAMVPLVVFSHGIGSSRNGYSYLGRHFARHGVACLHLQHVGSDTQVWLGNPFMLVSRLWEATSEREALQRVRDLSFALDELLERSKYGARIDRTRIAAAGHSYGANTVMLAAGATLQRNGHSVQFREPRIRAALLLSAPPFYGEPELNKILGAVTLPTLHITATEDVIRVPGYYSPPADRLAVFDAAGSHVKTLAVFEGGSHSIFTDRGAGGAMALSPRVKGATQELALAFLHSVFDAQDDAMLQWRGKYSALISRWVHLSP
jgi:predicted dienelactone hydrolase